MTDVQKLCFVVMGFGRKTDYELGHTFDLDATYEAIIQPAVESCGFRCVRANEILHSGVIDVKMYEMLLRADLVIADISTGNVNAVYELGVRHALKPFSTIIMKEKTGKLHFDLDPTATFMYEHLGDDIGHREAKRAKTELEQLIWRVTNDPTPDSPVYTYIPTLREPTFSDAEFEEVLVDAEEVQEKFSTLLSEAELAADESRHEDAAKKFKTALDLSPDNSYLRQQAALHTYKSKKPSEPLALMNAQLILEELEPEKSNDPETLGLSGAIHKRLWFHTGDLEILNRAIQFYHKGFELRGDYYNGQNAADCLSLRSTLQKEEDEALFDRMSATKIREVVIENLNSIVSGDDFDERSDQIWIYATLANCSLAIADSDGAARFEAKFYELKPANWQKETYENSKAQLTSHA